MSKNGRIFFGTPTGTDILIFDDVNQQYVRQAINSQLRTDVFSVYPVRIYISFKVLFTFCRRLFAHSFSQQVAHPNGKLFGLLRFTKHVYLETCIICIRPMAVVTFIDNSGTFHWLSKNCRLFPFIAIQNGSRPSYLAATGNPDYHVGHLFCYGEHEANLFPKLGYDVKHYYPVGSLLASLFFDKQPTTDKYDILVVSTWRGNIGFTKEVQDTMRSMRIMDELLAGYCKTRNLRLAIILRNERDSVHWYMPEIGMNEMQYFQEIYGDTAVIIETNFSERNIFPLLQQSSFVISCLSSALYEAFGIGKKILFCNFTGVNTYHSDIHDSILTIDSSFGGFSARMDAILQQPPDEYQKQNGQMMKYYMNFPETCTTFQAISNKIDEIIRI